MSIFKNAAVSHQGSGRLVNSSGHNLIRLQAEDTGGRLGCLDISLLAGEGTPLHVHEREDEFFRVLSGRFGFWCADQYVELEPGGCILLPMGVPHRLANIGPETGELMVVVTPGGFESFFSTVESRNPKGPEEIAAIGAEFGIRFLPADTA